MAIAAERQSHSQQGPDDRIEPWQAGLVLTDDHDTAIHRLHRASDFIAAVLDTTGSLVVVLDRQGRLTHVNRHCEAVTGYTCEQVRGQHFWDRFIAQEEIEQARNEFEQLLDGRFPSQSENDWLTRDGSRRRIAWSNTALTGATGAVEYIIATGIDVTDLKQAQQALRQASVELDQRVAERTRSLVESNLRLEQEIHELRKAEEEMLRREEALEQHVEERTRDLATLLEISNAVALSEELEPLLRQTLDLLAGVVQHDGATVYRLEDERLGALLHRGPIPEQEVQQLRLPVERPSLAYELLSEQVPISIPDIHADTPPARAMRQVWGKRLDTLFAYFGSWLGLPLAVKGQLVGLLTLQRSEPLAFDQREIRLAEAFAGQLAVALENARLHHQAQQLAALEERQRLARELHDAVSQTLFSASLAAEVLPRLWEKDSERGRECLAEVRQLTRGALAEMRTLLLELRPATLAQTELAALLRQLAEAASSRARISVTVDAAPHCPLPAAVQLALYRIVQEALNNIAKHAGARQAAVTLQCAGTDPGAGGTHPVSSVHLTVTDDGRGFDPAEIEQSGSGMGLSIMQERAAAAGAGLHITSAIGSGTQITVVWPASGH